MSLTLLCYSRINFKTNVLYLSFYGASYYSLAKTNHVEYMYHIRHVNVWRINSTGCTGSTIDGDVFTRSGDDIMNHFHGKYEII